ncbi:Transcription factor bHLH30 [Bienertia sinuspersici]
MDSSFEVQSHGFSVFGSYVPDSMELYWKPLGGVGESSFPDCKKRKLVQTTASSSSGKNDRSQTKNSSALKTHCEAERRRRERINGHFTTLRNFLACTDKMDKATLLAEVIAQVKVLKKQAIEASKGLLVPTDSDEVIIEPYSEDELGDSSFAFRVSICCHYKPELIPDIRQAINDLKLTITKAEMSTLEGRVKNVLIVTGCKEDIFGDDRRERLAKSIHEALRCVLEKISASEEYSPVKMFDNKRRRVSDPTLNLRP